MVNKSPFIVIENFISPLLCEEIVDEIYFPEPDIDEKSQTVRYQSTYDDYYQKIILERLEPLIPNIEAYYNIEYKGTEKINFEKIPTGSIINPQCESCELISKQWVKTKVRDFCAVIFLCDYNDKPPFDNEFECYGGKLEFINHKFGFNPNRGTMVIYPSDPRFSNATSTVHSGELQQVRIHIASQTPYIYDPKQYPGDYRVWF
jgi:hypothetical protein